MFISVYNVYYLALFNFSTIEGDMFTVGILFGTAEFLGILFGEPVMHKFPDWIAMIFSLVMVMISTCLMRIPELDQMALYGIFLT